ARAARGDFVLHWGAHGLHYGIPRSILAEIAAGHDVIVNLSRGVLTTAADRLPGLIVLHLTATPATLARRLALRGRETSDQIAARLSRPTPPLPEGLDIRELSNDRSLPETVARAVALLQPVRG
ncbi:MAG: phosphonate metabolism protein/1,5-bisphosphokinase (PRPP-forming) PhnN, partial [Shimia sp.]